MPDATAPRPAPATSGQRETLDASAAELLALQHTDHPLPGWDVTCWVCRLTPAEAFRLGYRAGVAAAPAPGGEPCGHPNHGAPDHDCRPFTAPGGEPATGDQLREEMLAELFRRLYPAAPASRLEAAADAVLALDGMRSLLAAQEAVQRVRELAEEYERLAAEADEARESFPPREHEARDYYRRSAAVNRGKADAIRAAITGALS